MLKEHILLSDYLRDPTLVPIEKDIITMLLHVEYKTGGKVLLTDVDRTVKDLIKIYKKRYGDKWLDFIKWGSHHIAKFLMDCRAVDFKVIKYEDPIIVVKDRAPTEYFSGEEIRKILVDYSKNNNIFIGLGTGEEFNHVDVDRKSLVEWFYNY